MKKTICLFILLIIAVNMCACNDSIMPAVAPTNTVMQTPAPIQIPKKLYEVFNEELDKAVEEGRATKEGDIYFREGIQNYKQYTSERALNNDISLLERMLRNDEYLHRMDDYYKQYSKLRSEKEEFIELEKGFDNLINRKIYEVRGKDNEKLYDAAESFIEEIDNYMLLMTEYAQFGNDYLTDLQVSEISLKVYVEKVAKEAVELFLSKGAELSKLEAMY